MVAEHLNSKLKKCPKCKIRFSVYDFQMKGGLKTDKDGNVTEIVCVNCGATIEKVKT